jgi:WD40 repeat protein
VAVGTQTGDVNILNLTSTNQIITTLTGHTSQVNQIWNMNSALYATASGDTMIRIWNATSGNLLTTLAGHSDSVKGDSKQKVN